MTTTLPRERRYTTVDKSAWGPGEWQQEPDKMQWTDSATGYPCLIVRSRLGALCGYVGVTAEHPLFEKDYDEPSSSCDCKDAYCCEHTPDGLLKVHGGLTYADHCQQGPEDRVVCHVPEPGASDHVWWFGFDTAHSGDAIPASNMYPPSSIFDMPTPVRGYETYRTLDYVQREVVSLAAQLKSTGGEMTQPTARVLSGIVIDPDARIVQCKSCGAAIWWGRTAAGRANPFNVVGLERTAQTHFSTCSTPQLWSKR